ncbi:hypothetical protein [Bacillus horti]
MFAYKKIYLYRRIGWFLINANFFMLLYTLLDFLEELETRTINSRSRFHLIISRAIAFFAILLVVIFIVLLLSLLIYVFLSRFYENINFNFNKLLNPILLVTLLLIVPFYTNYKNKLLIYCRFFKKLLDIAILIAYEYKGSKLFFEIIIFATFVVSCMFLTLNSFYIYFDDFLLENIFGGIEEKLLVLLLFLFSGAYFSLRIFFLPDNNLRDKFIKVKSEFKLWLIVFLSTTAYLSISLFNNPGMMEIIYFSSAFLVSMVRIISTYKELSKSIDEYLEQLSFEEHYK